MSTMPTSPAQLAAARANGAKSYGPKTSQGKLASSRNALTHGLTARTVVLQNESAEDYEADLRAYLHHFLPVGKPETDLVHQLAAANWRLARYVGVESGLLEQKMDEQADQLQEKYGNDKYGDDKYEVINERHRLAIAFEALSGANGSLALLNRYQARLHREYQRLLKTLIDLQTARLARESASQRKQKSEQGSARPNPIHTRAPVSVVRASNKELPNEPKPAAHTGAAPSPGTRIPNKLMMKSHETPLLQELPAGLISPPALDSV